MKFFSILFALHCVALHCFGHHCAVLHGATVTVFTNGKIVTVDEQFKITDAMAIEGERIIAIGEQARAILKDRSEAHGVDLGGRMVLPGLMDSHVHPVGAATYEFDHPVPDIQDIPQLLEYIASRAKSLPEGSLIEISQIFITRLKEQRYPTRDELDRAAQKHPVKFSTGPDSMLNSLALQLAGIDRNFKVPSDSTGVVVFDAMGEPTGLMHAFNPKIAAQSPNKKPEADQTRELVKNLFAEYNSTGFTTVADRGASPRNIEVYQALRDANELSLRVRLSYVLPTECPWSTTEAAIKDVL
jgi:predicted amidohydrolase YtcJ